MNARATFTCILVVPSTFYVTEPDLFEGGDGLAGCVFGNRVVACFESRILFARPAQPGAGLKKAARLAA